MKPVRQRRVDESYEAPCRYRVYERFFWRAGDQVTEWEEIASTYDLEQAFSLLRLK